MHALNFFDELDFYGNWIFETCIKVWDTLIEEGVVSYARAASKPKSGKVDDDKFI